MIECGSYTFFFFFLFDYSTWRSNVYFDFEFVRKQNLGLNSYTNWAFGQGYKLNIWKNLLFSFQVKGGGLTPRIRILMASIYGTLEQKTPLDIRYTNSVNWSAFFSFKHSHQLFKDFLCTNFFFLRKSGPEMNVGTFYPILLSYEFWTKTMFRHIYSLFYII